MTQSKMVFVAILYLFFVSSIHGWIELETSSDSPCYNYRCPFGQRCKLINQQPICKCNHNCEKSRTTGPVCTTTGKMFANLCELKKEECKKGHFILIAHYGNCTKQATCFDNERERTQGLCADWFKHGACTNHASLMRKFCRKTCNFCDEEVKPTACKGRFGCCPGTSIPALGPNNQGCFQGCRDGRTCPELPNFCGNDINKETMKKYCPFTCRYCAPGQNEEVRMLTEDNI